MHTLEATPHFFPGANHLFSRLVPQESTTQPSTPAPHGHIPALDGVRGLAILLVLLTHGIDAGLRPSGTFEQTVYDVARWGWIGVDLFFVLSGFLITGILLSSKVKPNYYTNFFARRALRIFPLYCATILVCLVLLPMIPWSRFDWLRDLSSQQGWFWLHLSNYYKITSNEPPVYWMSTLWSLAVEEHFYFVWPFIVAYLAPKRLLQVCGLLILAGLAIRLGLTWLAFPGDYIYRSTLTRFDPLVMGAALALLARSGSGLHRFRGLAWTLIVAASAAVLVQMLLRHGGHGRDTTFYGKTFQYTVIGIGFASLLVVVLTSRKTAWLTGLFTSTPLLVLGKYSYALYILNKPCYLLVREWFRPSDWPVLGSQLPAVVLFILVGGMLTFLGSQITWRLLEKPCLDLKRFFEYRTA